MFSLFNFLSIFPRGRSSDPICPYVRTPMVTDLAVSLVTSCRPPVRPQNTPDDRTWNAGVAVRTADGSRRTADAGDEQCLSVCLSVWVCVCVFVHPRSSYLRNYTSDLCLIFWRMLPMAVARSSSGGVVIRYVLPVLWMTSHLHT